ncbi:MAG: hypothetical protein NTZ60_04405 [Campylobacterales bacterium]|nr:hypothetical protein [Campylobacterales bacterium]
MRICQTGANGFVGNHIQETFTDCVIIEYYASVIESKNIDFGFNFLLFGHGTVIIEKQRG